MVFQALAVSDDAARQLPVQVQLPETPWSTNGCSEDRPLPDGIQMWNVTTLPGPAAGEATTTVAVPWPPTLTASACVPAKARVVELAAPVSGAPEIAQPCALVSKLYCAASAGVLPPVPPVPAVPVVPPRPAVPVVPALPVAPPAPVVAPPLARVTPPALMIAPARLFMNSWPSV